LDWKEKYLDMLFPLNASDARTEAAFALKHHNLPGCLYKYREANEYAKVNLRDGTIWLADPESLNDPYDCAHTIDQNKLAKLLLPSQVAANSNKIPERLREHFVRASETGIDPFDELLDRAMAEVPCEKRAAMSRAITDARNQMYDQITRDSNATFKSAFKLCSFSERVDSVLMWSHYANYHKGFCIEYNIAAVTPESYVSRFMHPVVYSDELPDLTEHFARSPEDQEFHNLYPNRIGLYKAADWAYEREWRLLISNGLLKEAQPFAMPKPMRVYLGSKINADDKEEIMNVCKEIGVPTSQMRLSLSAYKMEAVPNI
jgi:hypothetical protein